MKYRVVFHCLDSNNRSVRRHSKEMAAGEAMSLCKHMRKHFGRFVWIDIFEKKPKKCWVKSDIMKIE